MDAMHYEITLPADYDMSIIRQRVAAKGGFTDAFPGLGLKAYLIRERGKAGSLVNQYAPFYLWTAQEGMHRFLWGDGFRGLRQSFGRPVVQHWLGMEFRQGTAHGTVPHGATKQVEAMPQEVDLDAAIEINREACAGRARAPGVYGTAFAIDPYRWEVVHFTLWEEIPGDAAGVRYEVLHLSAPHVANLTGAPAWNRAS